VADKEAMMARLSPGQIQLAQILADAWLAKQRALSTTDRSNNENSNLRSVQLGQAERNLPN